MIIYIYIYRYITANRKGVYWTSYSANPRGECSGRVVRHVAAADHVAGRPRYHGNGSVGCSASFLAGALPIDAADGEPHLTLMFSASSRDSISDLDVCSMLR